MNPQPSGIKSARTFGPGWAIAPESNRCTVDFKAPAFVFGDRLYVRESWRCEARYDDLAPRDIPSSAPIYYAADPDPRDSDPGCAGRYRHGRFMPRWASRLTLTVTEVRVQRLQDISEDDALAEGVEMESADPPFYYVPGIWPHSLTAVGIEEPGGRHAERSFAKLWNSLHGADAWERNDWVAAYTFTVQRGNIDQIGATA
jgi:hypothetical protein